MPIKLYNIAKETMVEQSGEPTGGQSRKEKRGEGMAEETKLFARFLDGDDGAFLELFDRHAARIGRYCYRLIGDPERAQDIVQDLWEKLVRLRAKGQGEVRNPMGLIYTIARNLCLNHIRDRRPYIPLHTLDEEDHPAGETRELTRHEEMAILALERLPLPQREVLILNAYSDYNFDEIAEMIGETHGAVRTKAWRARRQLRRIIAAMIEFDENYTDRAE